MRYVLAALIVFSLVPVVTVATISDAAAQACQQKCTEKEAKCMKSKNPGKCGPKLKTCMAKCK